MGSVEGMDVTVSIVVVVVGGGDDDDGVGLVCARKLIKVERMRLALQTFAKHEDIDCTNNECQYTHLLIITPFIAFHLDLQYARARIQKFVALEFCDHADNLLFYFNFLVEMY